MTTVASTTGNSTPATAIAGAADWRTAATDLIGWLVSNDRCFSSGELGAYLRTYRPDLAFRIPGLGEYVRDLYDNGQFPSYTDSAGQPVYPTQVPRTTTGVAITLDGRQVEGRTPAGFSVFVYAQGSEGFAHDFEVYIPDYDDPQAARATAYVGTPATQPVMPPVAPPMPGAPAVQVPTAAPTAMPPSPATAVLITGALKRDDLEAYVRPDRRLCVPRAAFEAFVALTGVPLRGGPQGDPVHIEFVNGNGVQITRDATPGSAEYHLWGARGRVAMAAGAGMTPFNPGDKFEVKVSSAALWIDLTQKV